MISRLRFPILAIVTLLWAARTAAIEPIQELEPAPAAADSADPAKENVWSHGVPEASRRAAEALFYEGNRLMRESITLTAAAKYREALKHWNHPNIHYNLAVALMTLDQPVETYENLQEATKYGDKPLEHERYEHARNYVALLEKQLARVKISCSVGGGSVELDGRVIIATPGEYEGLVRAGRHTLVARREGYVTNQSTRVLEGGQATTIDLELKTMDELTVTSRRWSAWKPWALVGSGVVVAAAGAALHSSGNSMIRTYDRRSQQECRPDDFCSSEPPELAKLRKDGRTRQTAGVAGYAVGATAIATGALMVFMNRGQTHVRPYDNGTPAQPAPQPQEPRVQLSPLVTPESPGLSVLVRF